MSSEPTCRHPPIAIGNAGGWATSVQFGDDIQSGLLLFLV